MLQRKSRNSVTGMILVSDTAETTRRAQMDLVLARTEAANVPIHSFGYGRSHDPASLWLMSNHTSGTYTFVKDWYDLRDCLAGCIGGMMSIGLLHMKLHMKIVDGQRFRIRKISGGPLAILSSDGRDVDVELGELRYGERKEMLIELELDNSDVAPMPVAPQNISQAQRALNATDQFMGRMGLDALSIADLPDLSDGMMDRMIDEVPVFEVDGSFFDPSVAKHVSRLAHPVLLTVTLLPNTGSRPRTPAANGSDPVIVRRRMELLASDMITRALVLVSRKNVPQAQKLLTETRRILHTVLQNITQALPPPSREGVTARNRKEFLTLSAVRAIQAVLQDMQILAEALEDNADLFTHDQRNFGAQQVNVSCSHSLGLANVCLFIRPWFFAIRRAGAAEAPSNGCFGQSTIPSSWSQEVLTGLRANNRSIYRPSFIIKHPLSFLSLRLHVLSTLFASQLYTVSFSASSCPVFISYPSLSASSHLVLQLKRELIRCYCLTLLVLVYTSVCRAELGGAAG